MRSIINRALRNQTGSALVAVVLVGIVAMILTLVVMRSTGHSVKKAGTRRSNVVLLNIAEAGKEHAIGLVKSRQVTLQPNAVVNIVSCSNFNGGAYIVSCSSNVSTDTLYLKSTATYKGTNKSIEIVCNMVSCTLSGEAFNMAICAGGDIAWGGTGKLDAGTSIVFCNGLSLNGSSDIIANIQAVGGLNRSGSSTITGDVWAPWITETGCGDIIGTKTVTTISAVKIPVINTEPYYAHALANGQVFNSDQHFSGSSSMAVPGGIMWVNGNFKRSDAGDFSGCIVATGDIELAGSGNYYKVGTYPLAVSISGKVDFSGSGTVHGLLFAANGDFEKTGSGDVVGSIICKGDLKKSGGWSFLTYEKNLPVAPGCSGDLFKILKWREL